MAPRPQLFSRPPETAVTKLATVTMLPCYPTCTARTHDILLSLPYAIQSMPRASDPNRCLASECEPIGRSPGFLSPAENQGLKRKSPPATAADLTHGDKIEPLRLHLDEVKRDIVQRYEAWLRSGKRAVDSPIAALMEEYKCGRNYPKNQYEKLLANGTLENLWSTNGRPLKYGEETEAQIIDAIREKRNKQKKASCREISRKMKKENRKKPAPSASTVHRKKKALGFEVHKVQKKPMLNKTIMKEREIHAKTHIKRSETEFLKSIRRTIYMDQKWFTEHKGNDDCFEARPGSPIKQHLYKSKAAETNTQRIKAMYLLVVSVAGPIGCYELPFKEWNERHGQLTRGGKLAKGITADFMRPILQKVAKDAVKVLGPGPIDVEFDKAGAHQALVGDGDIPKIFGGEGRLAPGKAPDMSPLDAGACPFLERAVEAAGAETLQEIRAAVRKAWKTVDAAMCVAIMKRVRRNMSKVIGLKGGNFYRD